MRLTVARVGRAHGLRGEVTVDVRTDVPERRFVPGASLYVVPGPDPRPVPGVLTIRSVRDHNGVLLLAFDEVVDRTGAEVLRNARLEADVPDDESEPDAWYDHQLVGLAAVDPAGVALGEIVAVQHPGAQDLLVVRRSDGQERLVPFVTAIVPAVDVAGGHVVIDAPPGLLDDLPEE
ncbi:MAG TPA: ribosome maturation factor RimM [Kineosporiaceae bacterium]